MKEFKWGSVRIVFDEEKLKKLSGKRILVTGFKGFGMVGYISTYHLVSKTLCERLGFVLTKYLPEAVTYAKYGVTAPFELFACRAREGLSLVILVNHDLPDVRERSAFAEAVIRWAKDVAGISEAVFVGGFDSRYRMKDEKLRWLCTSHYAGSLDAPRVDEGLYVIGPLALVTLYAEILGVPAIVVLPYTEAARPDPRAAAVALETISKLYGFEVDVSELYEEAKRIEELIARMERQKEVATAPSTAERVYM